MVFFIGEEYNWTQSIIIYLPQRSLQIFYIGQTNCTLPFIAQIYIIFWWFLNNFIKLFDQYITKAPKNKINKTNIKITLNLFNF